MYNDYNLAWTLILVHTFVPRPRNSLVELRQWWWLKDAFSQEHFLTLTSDVVLSTTGHQLLVFGWQILSFISCRLNWRALTFIFGIYNFMQIIKLALCRTDNLFSNKKIRCIYRVMGNMYNHKYFKFETGSGFTPSKLIQSIDKNILNTSYILYYLHWFMKQM